MLAGPLFRRQVLIAPRPARHFLIRTGYLGVLFVLMYTAGQATFGWQGVRDVGDSARFGKFLFDLFSVVQLTLVIAASLLFSAGGVSQEKDRRTLVLLLMTDLSNVEVVLGKMLSSLLSVIVLIAVSLPVFCLIHLLGGISMSQILWMEVLCLAAALASGAWGVLVAFWRDKTFQTLAITVLGTVLFIGTVEMTASLLSRWPSVAGWLAVIDPYRALFDIMSPLMAQPAATVPVVEAWRPVTMLLIGGALLTAVTIARVRAWNPSKGSFEPATEGAPAEDGRPGTARARVHRPVSRSPILWREICTRAYGRRIVLIKAAYLVFAALAVLYLWRGADDGTLVLGLISRPAAAFVAISLVALILVNAQAVTAITSERDGQTLELVMVTEVSSREFIFGKLAGILFNTKEVLAAPFSFLLLAALRGFLSLENTAFLMISFSVLTLFSAILGIHHGLTYTHSRQAILHSLGTMFFLFVGIFVCMLLIVETRASYALQLVPFLVFIFGGSVALYMSLAHRNPSPALFAAASLLPIATFYGITAYFVGFTEGLMVFLVVIYGYSCLAMLMPAISGFEVSFGESTKRS